MKEKSIHLAIIEDDEVVRNGLVAYFQQQSEFDDVLSAASVEEFFEFDDLTKIHVVLTDIGLPGKSGIDGIKLIKEKSPSTDIIMITVFKDADKIFKSLCAGATGYLLKGAGFEEIRESVFTILGGGSYMSPPIARLVVKYFNPEPNRNEHEVLTPREEQIVKALVDGLSYKLIAERLGISIDTVRYHIKNIYAKMQVNSKSEVVARFLKRI